MSLDLDAALERRRLSRSRSRWRFFTVLLLVAGLLAGLYALDPGALIKRRQNHVALLEVSGVIAENAWISEKLMEAAEDDNVVALVVHINSPGGTTYGGEQLYTNLRKVAVHKPVVTVIGTLGASAGYMAAVAGDRVFARETSLTGSIGVLFQTAEFSKLMEKIGVSAETITSGALKAEPSPTKPLSPAGREQIQRMVMETHAWFVNLVAERRGLPREEVAKLADGRVYSGRAAFDLKLIDALGDQSDARVWLAAERGIPAGLPLVEIPPHPPVSAFAELLGGQARGLIEKALFSERLRLDGLLSVWHAD